MAAVSSVVVEGVAQRFALPKNRILGYCALAGLFFLLANLCVLAKPHYNFVVSDGRFYYVYLPSVVIDHDLHFSNEIRNHWDADFSPDLLRDKTPRGYVPNEYPIGWALSLAPGFLVAHALSHLLYAATGSSAVVPDGYSIVYQLATLVTILAYGLLMMIMIDRLLEERFRIHGTAILLAIVSFWVGTNYSYYYFREPAMAHAVSAFWVTSCLYWGVTGLGSSRSGLRTSALLLLSFAMALVTRPTNIFIAPLVLIAFVKILRLQSKLQRWASVGFCALAFLPIALQMLTWKIMDGSWIYYSYGSESFVYWKKPFLIATLFSTRHGLFLWSPLLLLSVAGIVFYWRSARPRWSEPIPQLTLGACALWYFNSAWWSWWFGAAFGGRAFLELAPLFIFGLAFLFDALLKRRGFLTKLVGGFVCLAVIYNYVLMGLYISHRIPRGGYLF
jgi:hypothetical protein